MTRLLLKKILHESALLLLACTVLLGFFCYLRVWIVCQFDLSKFEPILGQLRNFEKFSPVPIDQFLTYAGNIGLTFSEPVLLICVLVWSISRGSDVVSGEMGRGTLEMLLAQPISRLRLLTTHIAVCIFGLILMCLVIWCGIAIGINSNSVEQTFAPRAQLTLLNIPLSLPIPNGEPTIVQTPLTNFTSPSYYVLSTLNLFSFGLFVHALATCISCFDRYRWRTIGFTIGFYVLQFLMFLLSRAVESFNWLGYFSFFAAYQPDAIVQFSQREPELTKSLFLPEGWNAAYWQSAFLAPLGLCAVLIGLALVLYVVGAWRFSKRDLPAPL